MKKTRCIFFLVGLFVLSNSLLFAQMMSRPTPAKGNVNYGITGGLDFANFKGDDIDNTDSRTFGAFGLFAAYNLSGNLIIQPEINYDVRGAESDIADQSTRFRLSYLEIPVMVKGVMNSDSEIAPFVSAGPSIAFKLDDRYRIRANGQSTSGDVEEIGLETRNVLFDLNFGAGVEVGRFILGGRYNLGLSDFFEDVDTQNSTFSINIGLGINNWNRSTVR